MFLEKMKLYVIFEIFDKKTTPLICNEDKLEAHRIVEDMDKYWKNWALENKIPPRQYEVRVFVEDKIYDAI